MVQVTTSPAPIRHRIKSYTLYIAQKHIESIENGSHHRQEALRQEGRQGIWRQEEGQEERRVLQALHFQGPEAGAP